MLQSTTGEHMALEGVSARGRVRGLLFELTVEQRYRNPGTKNIEAVYTFPLPFEAVLLDLDVELGSRKLSAVVVEKKEASARYEDAIDKGDTAIMLERAGDGLCTLNLGNLMAGESALIRYRYAQLLRFEHGSVRLAVPTVIAPRYGDPAAAGLDPHQVPTTDLAVAYPFALAIDLEGDVAKGRLASPSHAIATEPTEEGVCVSLARGAFLDRDFVLNVAGLAGRSLAVVAQDGEGYVALASFYADLPRDATELPLRVKLLVDCSGSMGGDSIDAAKRALHRILAGLAPEDRFSFSRFGSTIVYETKGLVAADGAQVRTASERLATMDADLGGTEMPAALRSVFGLGGSDSAADVLLITDGEIWDAEGLVAEARAAKQRVFVVGIGSAPAEGVLMRLAETSGGACEFVAPNEDAEGAILRMFARLRAPRVERAEVAWPGTSAWSTPLPRGLFGGETVHAFAGFASVPAGIATLKLVSRGEGAPLTAEATLPATPVVDRTLARVAAARRIETATESEQLRLALDYGLLTSRTNLIVVHERSEGEKAKDLPELAKVAQMHAAGWHGAGTVRTFGDALTVACLKEPAGAIAFDALDQPAFTRFRKTMYGISGRAPAHREIGRGDIPEFLRKQGDADGGIFHEPAGAISRQSASPLEAFLAVVEQHAPRRLPATLDDLASAGLPRGLLTMLEDLVRTGHDETGVVRALLEVLGAMLADGSIKARVSRHFARTLRRQFASDDEAREVRWAVRAAVEAEVRAVVA
jgi:Ca-activated chloride channel family protein